MRHNLVQLKDNKGRSFHIEVWTPGFSERSLIPFKGWNIKHVGSWRVIDHGFIRGTGGSAWSNFRDGGSFTTTRNLYLGASFGTIEQNKIGDAFRWGIKLNDFEGTWGTHDEGSGEILQTWVLNFEPGFIRWIQPNESQMVISNLDNRGQRLRP